MLDVVADRLLGVRAGNIMGVVSIVSLLAGISALTFAGPRVYFAMARDGAVLQARGARCIRAIKTPAVVDHRAGGVEFAAGAHGAGRRAGELHRLRDHAVLGLAVCRCSCCARASRTPSGRSGRGATRSRRRSMRWRVALILLNAPLHRAVVPPALVRWSFSRGHSAVLDASAGEPALRPADVTGFRLTGYGVKLSEAAPSWSRPRVADRPGS